MPNVAVDDEDDDDDDYFDDGDGNDDDDDDDDDDDAVDMGCYCFVMCLYYQRVVGFLPALCRG